MAGKIKSAQKTVHCRTVFCACWYTE